MCWCDTGKLLRGPVHRLAISSQTLLQEFIRERTTVLRLTE